MGEFMIALIIGLIFGLNSTLYASSDPDWSINATIIPGGNRGNIYEW